MGVSVLCDDVCHEPGIRHRALGVLALSQVCLGPSVQGPCLHEALMTQHLCNGFTSPASRHLSALGAGPASLPGSFFGSGNGTASTLPSCVCPVDLCYGIRLEVGNLHPEKALVGSRFNTPGSYFPKSGCGPVGDSFLSYKLPEVGEYYPDLRMGNGGGEEVIEIVLI